MPPSALAENQQLDEASHAVQYTDQKLIYFSSASEYTHRFVQKLNIGSARIPLFAREPELIATKPYVLVIPTYGGENGKRAVLPQILNFLRNEQNRRLLQGVIGSGNTNFGTTYCLAAKRVAAKCQVPVLYTFELMGTSEDVHKVKEGLDTFWTLKSQKRT
ncbi:Protein NrdI [Glutamicibacter creatinolyticus]|uniref:Protein NrdI n=1 Tax=Glutamicibacter creatinolyticus TaxID=162496 RepID=A0A5B7WTP5_9MICC|nr:Protein NrdI [Glutamicibacter creatinolyticus]